MPNCRQTLINRWFIVGLQLHHKVLQFRWRSRTVLAINMYAKNQVLVCFCEQNDFAIPLLKPCGSCN